MAKKIDLKKLTKKFGLVCINVSRGEVEALEMMPCLDVLNEAKSFGRVFKQRLAIIVDGYNEDPRELFEIPEVRSYFQFLDRSFPYWFYFLSRELKTLRLIVSCVCEVEAIVLTDTGRQIKIQEESLKDFFHNHFIKLNELAAELRIGEEELRKISDEAMASF